MLLREELETGKSFPAARQAALERMGADASVLSKPNDILAVEYCKAILELDIDMVPMVIRRTGGYHDTAIDKENPSATALREQMTLDGDWLSYVPEAVRQIFAQGTRHCLQAGEQAILYRLRTMTDTEYQALPYGNEGLWRKLMTNAGKYATLEEILTATKSKRYTRTRLDRMVMCAFLGITAEDLAFPAPYARVLALNDTGRQMLKTARQAGQFPNIGESVDSPYQTLENRAGILYSQFCVDKHKPPCQEQDRRVYYRKGD